MKNTIVLISLLLSSCSFFNQTVLKVDFEPEIVQNALQYVKLSINSEYIFGGNGPTVFDCSGLINWSYQSAYGATFIFNNGVSIVNDINMDTMYNNNVRNILKEDTSPGDIVFITDDSSKITHGGIIVNLDGDLITFINASSYYGKVVIDTWDINELVRGQWIVGFGKLQLSKKK